MKTIKLTQGYETIVDEADYERFSKYKWCVRKKPDGRKLAVRSERTKSGFKNYQLHREIMNCPNGMVVDHINGNTLDNRKENLRVCTIQQNSMNRKTQSSGKFRSKYKGVSWDKSRQKWIARVYLNGKAYTNGRHTSEKEAAIAYNELARKLHGDYARLNEIL